MADNKIVQTAIRFFLVSQAIFIFLTLAAFLGLTYRIKHFDYKDIELDQERIYSTISQSTKEFLENFRTNNFQSASSSSTNDLLKIEYVVGSIYGSRRGDILRYRGVDFRVGDFIDLSGRPCCIQAIDFERQRFYALENSGLCHIGIISAPVTDENKLLPSRASYPSRRAEAGDWHDGEGVL